MRGVSDGRADGSAEISDEGYAVGDVGRKEREGRPEGRKEPEGCGVMEGFGETDGSIDGFVVGLKEGEVVGCGEILGLAEDGACDG
jgi:hypothetical protein